jgi:putative RNA 2'-phosphotransferase
MLKNTSKFLSYVLRHKPESITITLDKSGWVKVEDLLRQANKYNHKIDMELLELVVKDNNKKRFEFSEDKKRIRASQGHSIEVDLGYTPEVPPKILYHGTSTDVLHLIFRDGIKKMKRHHVHLSDNINTASQVGSRHGKVIVLHIESGLMHNDGFEFFKSTNGVWLVDIVPKQYIKAI